VALKTRSKDIGGTLSLAFAVLFFGALLAATLTLPWLPVLVLALSVVVGLFYFTRPEYALLAFFTLRTVFDLLWWAPVSVMSLNVMELFSGTVAALALVLFYLEAKRFNDHPLIAPFIPYVVVILIAGLRHLDLRQGVETVARYMSTFLLCFLVTSFMSTTKKRQRMFLLFTATSAIPIIVSLYHLAAGQMSTYELHGYSRLLGGYKNLHNHGMMMMFFCTWAVFWVDYLRRGRFAFVFTIYGGLAALCLYLTYVRTGQLGLATFILVFLVVSRRYTLAFWFVLAVGIALSFSATMQDRFDDLLLLLLYDRSDPELRYLGSGRWALWTTSMREFLKYPLGDMFLGLGLGKHGLLTEPLYSEAYYNPSVGYIDTHNDYLAMLYQMGPIAMFSYLICQAQVVRYGLRLRNIARDAWERSLGPYMVALSVTVFVTNFVSNSFVARITLGWYFWGLAGLLFGQVKDAERARREAKERQLNDPEASRRTVSWPARPVPHPGGFAPPPIPAQRTAPHPSPSAGADRTAARDDPQDAPPR